MQDDRRSVHGGGGRLDHLPGQDSHIAVVLVRGVGLGLVNSGLWL